MVVADDVRIDVLSEVTALCDSFAPINERALLVIPRDEDCADVVLASLGQFSIRYHPLSTTSPYIVESLRVLAGPLTVETIRAAGRANRATESMLLSWHLDRIVRCTIDLDTKLRRQDFWQALMVLRSMQEELLILFAATHGGERPYHAFDQLATPELQHRLGMTLHVFDHAAARAAFVSLLDLIEQDIPEFTAGQLTLNPAQREVIAAVRQRLNHGN